MSLMCFIVCAARYFIRQVGNSVLTCVTSTMAMAPTQKYSAVCQILVLLSSTKTVRFFEPDKSSKHFNVILTYSNPLICSSNSILF